MEKISLKTVISAVLCIGGGVYLGGCVEPFDLLSYVNDEEVQEILDKGGGTVNLAPGSDAGLNAGNKKVTGLASGKYYLAEEWDENNVSLGVQFVRADGKLSADITDIGMVSGGELTGLTNRHRYKVNAAAPLTGSISYQDLITPDSGSQTITDGSIILPGPIGSGVIVYTFGHSFSPSDVILEIPVLPAGRPASLADRSPGDDIIALIYEETVNDYVFYENVPGGDFAVLRVLSDPSLIIPPDPGGNGNLAVTVTFTMDHTEKTFTLTPATVSFSQAVLETAASKEVTVTLDNPNSFVTGSIKWTYNKGLPDEKTWSGATLIIDFADPAKPDNIDLLVIGSYTITIEATVGGVGYNSSLVLEIIP